MNSDSRSKPAYESGWDPSDDNLASPANVNNFACDAAGAGHATGTALAVGNERLPINCVNSYTAYAFCIWDGGFLPSEAE